MTHAAKLARHDALTEAIRAADEAIGAEEPTPQALRIIAAIKRLRDGQPARVASLDRTDYLGIVQEHARTAHLKTYAADLPFNWIGPTCEATAGIDTPLGRLVATVWRQQWTGKRGERIAWAGSYTLDGETISVAEIKAAGLAQRPTTRNRQRKDRRE